MPALTALTLLWFACLPAPSQGPSAAERLTLAPPTLNEVNEAQAVITVTLRLGSASDPTGKEGLSALLAAMITADANARAATTGGQASHRITRELASFTVTGPGDAAAALAEALGAAIITPNLTQEGLERARTAAQRTLTEPDPESLAAWGLMAWLYEAHPYRHPPEGRLGALSTLTLDDLRAQHGARVVRSGAFSGVSAPSAHQADAAARLHAALATLPPTVATPPTPKPVAKVEGVKGAVVVRPGDAAFALGHPLPALNAAERAALDHGLAAAEAELLAPLLKARAPAPRLSLRRVPAPALGDEDAAGTLTLLVSGLPNLRLAETLGLTQLALEAAARGDLALALLLHPPPSVTLGMLLVAACPGGPMSNFMTHLARGNTELSVALTAATTTAALLTTPLNLAFWAGLHPDAAPLLRSVALDPADMLRTIGVVIAAPLALGMLIAGRLPRLAAPLRRPLRILSMAVFVVMLIIAVRSNLAPSWHYLPVILGVVVVHNALAFATGYLSAAAARLDGRDRRAITIEVGIQNAALALIITVDFFAGLGGMALVAACWGVWHLIAGFGLVGFWRLRDRAAARS